MGRRAAHRPLRAHERIHLPFGGSDRAAAELGQPHADDDVRGRAVPHARTRDRGRPRVARGRDAPSRVVALPARGARPPGRLGEELRPARRDRLRGGGVPAVPPDRRLERARRAARADGRAPGPDRAHDGVGGGSQARRCEDPDRRSRPGDPGSGRAGNGCRHGPRRDRGRGRRQRLGDLGQRARADGRGRDPRRADGAPVPHHATDRRGHRAVPHAPRPGQPGLRARGGRRARGRRLRAQPRPLARGHPDPGRLQPPAPPGAVGAVRADRRRSLQPDPGPSDHRDQPVHQRSRGVHARRRLHPRRDRGGRLLRRGRLLRPRDHGWRGRRPVHGRMDRRRRAVDGPVEDGRAALRQALPQLGGTRSRGPTRSTPSTTT